MATVGEQTLRRSELDPITVRTLASFRRRRGLLLLLRAIGVGMLAFVTLALMLATLDYLFYLSDTVRWALSLSIYVATAIAMWLAGVSAFRVNDALEIARHVESTDPNLRENLVSAVELADPDAANGSPYFRRLLQSRVAKRMSRINVRELLPLRLVRRWVLSGLCVVAFCVAMMFIPSAQFGRRFARAALPGLAIERASTTKVTIIEPSPPSRYVAERDAVGVIVSVAGADAEDVMLHWRSADGTSGETLMTPRMDADAFQPGRNAVDELASDSSDQSGERWIAKRYAANLSIGSVRIQYRITAGDAITLWHELTPLPRPRVVRFEKLYRLPAYAKLEDRTADEEHGDLKALQGTTAEVTVTFDQPVESPVIRFGVRGARSGMEPADESGTRFLTRISIKTSGQYQVDATSVKSGLNNPFSPTNMITPVLDTPPVVRWSNEVEPSRMVSSLDVVDLAAFAADDLPLEKVMQEVRVNEQEFRAYALPVDVPDRKLDLAWSWDLMHRLGENSETKQLAAGDLIKTRLVAIDRRGTRTESRLIEFLIAGDGFDADRYEFLEPFSKQTGRIISWAGRSQEIAKTLQQMGKSQAFDELADVEEKWKTLQKESVELIKEHSAALTSTLNSANASMTELVAQSITDVETRLDGQIRKMRWLADRADGPWDNEKKKHCGEVGREADQSGHQCERLREFAQARFGMSLSAALYSDVKMLRDNVERLVSDVPRQRLQRYVTLVIGQIAEIDRLIAAYEPLLTQQHLQHLSGEHWSRWSQRWTIQLERLQEDKASRDQILAVLSSLRDELKKKPQHAIFSGTHNTLLRWGRDIRNEKRYLYDLTQELLQAGRRWQQSIDAERVERNADKVVVTELNSRWHDLAWKTALNRLVVRAGTQEKLNRSKSQVDLQYAADQSLFQRAIKNVTSQGYKAYKDESADKVLAEIAKAIAILQGCSDIAASRNDWIAIREGERQEDDSPLRKLFHPIWFKLQDSRIELGVRYLRQSGLDWQQYLERIDRTRHNDDHNVAYSRLDSRQWRMDPFVSAGSPMEAMARDVQLGLQNLDEKREEAREVLRRYVLKLSEQAREAAEAAEQAREETDGRTDDSEKAAEEVQPEQDDAVEKATETIAALADQANTSDIIDDQQREVARDADAAAELIAEALKETKEAMKDVDAANAAEQRKDALEQVEEKLDALSEKLNQTAEHFEKVENGEDVTESRQELRQAEQDLQSGAMIQERYDQADEMAETAKQDPRELLEQLEEELRRNEPMQDALSDISAETVEDVAKNLEQAAKDEDALQRQLETEDKAFAEQKRQKQLLLEEFVERASTLRNQTLQTTSQTASWANEPKTRELIEKTRVKLDEAIKQAREAAGGNPTMQELQQAASDLGEEIEKASDNARRVSEQLAESVKKDLHGDQRKRQAAATSVRQYENRLRNEELRSLDRQRKKWSSTERDAARRVRTAEQNERRAEDAMKREQAKLKKNADDERAKREIQNQQDRREEAARTAEQARQTKELATDRRKKADERANQMNRTKSMPLDQPNPAAQLGEKLSETASERLQQLAKELEQLEDQSNIADNLQARPEAAESLANRQGAVVQDVDAAVDDLERAARHEARLENDAMSEKLANTAAHTEERAGNATREAGGQLQQTAEEADNASQAGQALRQASEELSAQAEAVAAILGQQPETEPGRTGDPQSGQPQSGEPQSGQPSQKANSQTPSSADPSQSPSQSSGQSPSGQSSATSGQPSSSTPGEGQPGGQPSSQPGSPQQLAQTLDELDRSLAAQSSSSSSQSGDPSAQGSANGSDQSQGDPSSSQQPGGQPSDEGRMGAGQQGQNAIDASPTLAEMLEAQMQQAARERMKSLQQAQDADQAGQPMPSDSNSTNPVSESGDGEASGGPEEVDLLRGAIDDGEWGDLRRRGVDDAAQGRSIRIPAGYSREVRAYFKALSKRAADAEKAE